MDKYTMEIYTMEIQEFDMMFNNQECRIFNEYIHIESLTNDVLLDFLTDLSDTD